MRNKNHSHMPLEAVHGGGKAFRRILIQPGRGFVENQNLGSFHKRSGNGDTLPLPAENITSWLAGGYVYGRIPIFPED